MLKVNPVLSVIKVWHHTKYRRSASRKAFAYSRTSRRGRRIRRGRIHPPLNKHGASDFDKIVGTPTRKNKGSASDSASAASTRATTNPHDDCILQLSDHQEQLKQLFLLVSSLESKIEAVAQVVAESSSSITRVEPPECGPSHHGKGKAAPRNVSFAKEVQEKKDENDENDNFDDDRGIGSGDDWDIIHGTSSHQQTTWDIIRRLRQEVSVEVGVKQAGLLPHRQLRHEDSHGLQVLC